MSGKVSSKIVVDGLVLNLDSGNPNSYISGSTTWNDLTYNKNNGTLINGPTFNSNNCGSIVFDGVNDYGTIPYNSKFNLSITDYTLEGWFNSNSFSSGQAIITKDTNGISFDWCLYIPNSSSLKILSNGTSTNVTANVPTMNTGQWYHCVVTSVSGTIKIYLNGVLYQTQSMSTSNNSLSYVTIGCASWNLPNGFINGNISILRIYNVGLSGVQVLENYNALKNRYI